MNVATSSRTIQSRHVLIQLAQVRFVSSSPYGRTHVWRRRAPKLPNPVVPQFPQRVTLADGSTFVHWTTSPRSSIRLTRDNTNNPIWNPWLEAGNAEDLEGAVTGRMGRFRRRFEELGGVEMQSDWIESEVSDSNSALCVILSKGFRFDVYFCVPGVHYHQKRLRQARRNKIKQLYCSIDIILVVFRWRVTSPC